MASRLAFWILVVTFVALLPFRSPAPLYFVPGEGWYYEPAGEKADWQRSRAKDQLEVAEEAFTNKNYKVTLHAAHRVARVWPYSDYAPRAEYLIARCLEKDHKDEAAFHAYQEIITKYPKSRQYDDVLQRQYEIAGRFLAGEWFRLWNTIPIYPSMSETAKLYKKIVNNGPYSDIAPRAQLKVGEAYAKGHDYDLAVKAYDLAADRYHNRPKIAADAMYAAAMSWQKQADTAEYDQGAATEAINAYTDFMTFYPDDKRVPAAQKAIVTLKAQRVQGSFEIARFYEKNHQWAGAVVYYNDVLQLDPDSPLAKTARERIAALKPRVPDLTAK